MDQRGRSQSPKSKDVSQRPDPGSPSHKRRRRSRFDQGPDGEFMARGHDRGSTGDETLTQSKWARHRDNNPSSSEEEDRQLEMTYQEKERKLAEEQDVFGLNKIMTS